MKRCTYCGRDNTDDAVQCHECGTEFERLETPTPEQPEHEYEFAPLSAADRQNDLVTLARCRTLMAADILASRLRAADIHTFLPDECLMQAVGWNFNTYGYVRVQVSPKDYDAARSLLSGIDPD